VWGVGDWIVRREVWRGRPWLGTIVRIVEDRHDLLVSYLPEGAECELDAGRRWWDDRWRDFAPDPTWKPPPLPAGWEAATAVD